MIEDYPQVIVGEIGAESPDWRKMPAEDDPDDEELEETPEEIVAMLGFDPLDAA